MNRRGFVGALSAAAVFGPRLARAPRELADGYITDVDGLRVGHFTDPRRPTGCTVVLYERGAVTGVDVRGSAPGTRETDLLQPINTVDRVNAILLSGGSAFGLDAASGVMRYLDERNVGYATGAGHVPIVPAAILYDLNIGDGKIRPTADSGYRACTVAAAGPVAEGSIGAGAGATIGKFPGGKAMRGGIGTASIRLPSGLVVAAIVAVNCVGDVINPKTGQIVAGARTTDGKSFLNIAERYRSGTATTQNERPGENTTIGIVATNARFDKTQMTKIAQMSHDGLARAINPAHTPNDGDTLFAMSTGTAAAGASLTAIGALAAEVVSDAILRGVMRATAIPGYSSYSDIHR